MAEDGSLLREFVLDAGRDARFIVGATLSILGILFVSVFAQFVIATDLAMVGEAVPEGAVGGSGAWLSAGLVAAVLVTFLQASAKLYNLTTHLH